MTDVYENRLRLTPAVIGVVIDLLSMTFSKSDRVLNGGQLFFTSGIRDWVATGVEPWASKPNPNTYPKDWRQHYLAVIVVSHLSGDQGDTCPEDHRLNREVFENPGTGGRMLTLWHRNGASKIFCITDDWGGPNAVTTVLFASEY